MPRKFLLPLSLGFFVLGLILILLASAPAEAASPIEHLPQAQDEPTPTPTAVPDAGGNVPESNVTVPMFWIFTAVIFGLLAVIALVGRPLIVQLGQSAPPWAVNAAGEMATALMAQAAKHAAQTPSPIDDTLVKGLEAEIKRLREQIEGGQKPGSVQVASAAAPLPTQSVTATQNGPQSYFQSPPSSDNPHLT